MTDHRHLTEDERQSVADGLVADSPRGRELHARVSECASCAADVARLKDIMTRYQTEPRTAGDLDALWPGIRSRIEAQKLVALGAEARAADGGTTKRSFTVRHAVAVALVAAVIVFTAILVRPSHRIPEERVASSTDSIALQMIADSVRSYEDEARTLLNRLEMQRAMLRPEAVKSMDHDLEVIDQAIAELKTAIANDPRNPALRRLLASSYRQKIQLLERANNAS